MCAITRPGSTVVILAGGKSSRMGVDKTKLELGDETMLSFVVNKYMGYFENVVLSVGECGKYKLVGVREVADLVPGIGPMSGLYSAFKQVRTDELFLIAADMPLAPPELALKLMEMGRGYKACVVRRSSGLIEPLFAMYSRECIEIMEGLIGSRCFTMLELIKKIEALIVDEATLFNVHPGISDKSFLNINRPEDFLEVLELLRK